MICPPFVSAVQKCKMHLKLRNSPSHWPRCCAQNSGNSRLNAALYLIWAFLLFVFQRINKQRAAQGTSLNFTQVSGEIAAQHHSNLDQVCIEKKKGSVFILLILCVFIIVEGSVKNLVLFDCSNDKGIAASLSCFAWWTKILGPHTLRLSF